MKAFVLSISLLQHPCSSPLLELSGCHCGLQTFRSYPTGLQKAAAGPWKECQEGRKRVHDVKREASVYSDTWERRDTGMLVVATARVETELQPAG